MWISGFRPSAALAAALLTAGSTAAASPTVVPVDAATQVNGVDVACTGIGLAAREDSRWAAFSVRVEVSNARNEYLLGADVTVRDRTGRSLVEVHCDAPWVLLRLPPGAYRVDAAVAGAGAPRSAPFSAPDKGQLRVVLQFPDT